MTEERLLKEEMLTVKAVARRLNVSDKLIYKMIAEGRIPHIKVGKSYRILKSELSEWLRSHYHLALSDEEQKNIHTCYEDNKDPVKEEVKKKQNGKCYICGAPLDVIHHVIPQSLGGLDHKENYVGLCGNCHARLHAFYCQEAQKQSYEKDRDFFNKALIRFKEKKQT